MFKVQIFEFQSEQSPIFVKERASDVPPALKIRLCGNGTALGNGSQNDDSNGK